MRLLLNREFSSPHKSDTVGHEWSNPPSCYNDFSAAFNQAEIHGACLLRSFERIRSLISQKSSGDEKIRFSGTILFKCYESLIATAVFLLTKGQILREKSLYTKDDLKKKKHKLITANFTDIIYTYQVDVHEYL